MIVGEVGVGWLSGGLGLVGRVGTRGIAWEGDSSVPRRTLGG